MLRVLPPADNSLECSSHEHFLSSAVGSMLTALFSHRMTALITAVLLCYLTLD
jgi:hypothetical protein